jgi:(1->4)-alpha-D-glucan 1-alpha-D-glucosylmutase
LYRCNRLIALNEVGSEPGQFGTSIADFHRANLARLAGSPRTMLTTSTHDTKRGEDARARIAALARHRHAWGEKVAEWHRLLTPVAAGVDSNEEYFFYQLLLGAWPVAWRPETDPEAEAWDGFRARIAAAMLKSVREAAVHTSWSFGDPAYERAVTAMVEAALHRGPDNGFLRSFRSFEAELAPDGAANGLIQTVLKLTIPGVPDTFQGAELWEQSLVDPDNRRPVDFAVRERMMADEGLGGRLDPATKLTLFRRLLGLRQAKPGLFLDGGYEPLGARGPGAASVCAFARRRGSDCLIVAVALPRGTDRADRSTRIELSADLRRPYRDVFTGTAIADLAGVPPFAALPLAVFVGETGSPGSGAPS